MASGEHLLFAVSKPSETSLGAASGEQLAPQRSVGVQLRIPVVLQSFLKVIAGCPHFLTEAREKALGAGWRGTDDALPRLQSAVLTDQVPKG